MYCPSFANASDMACCNATPPAFNASTIAVKLRDARLNAVLKYKGMLSGRFAKVALR